MLSSEPNDQMPIDSMHTNDRNGWMPVLDFFSDGCFQQIKDFLEISELLKMLVSL